MIELILVIIGLLIISFLCSILESVILSITRPYIEILVKGKAKSGKMLRNMKENIEEPISAILTLNTISHTVGAAVSGAIALRIFGSEWMALFSGVLTLLILIFSEIIPKTLGAQYWKSLGPFSAYILKGMIFILKPLIVPIHFLSSLLSKKNPGALVSKDEIYHYIRIGFHQGVIQSPEFEIIENLFNLQKIMVKDIMTPRTVVSWLPHNASMEEMKTKKEQLLFSRIPLYNATKNKVTGIVLRREIMNRIAKNKIKSKLSTFALEPKFITGTMTVFKLLNFFINEKEHIAIVINEFGDFSGIVTMEDAVETLLGEEIVDEFDLVADMRELAKIKSDAQNNIEK